MLTLAQGLAIFLHKPEPPWSTETVPGDRRQGVSVRDFLTAMSNQQVLAFVDIRPVSLLQGVTSVRELRDKWDSATVDNVTLKSLATVLQRAGASIVYQSRDRKVIGIRGTSGGLGTIGTIPLDEKTDPNKDINNALATIGQGGGAAASGTVALAGAAMVASSTAGTAGTVVAIMVVGSYIAFTFAGIVIGAGLAAYFAALAEKNAQSKPNANPPPSGSGTPSASSDPNALINGFDLILGEIPDRLGEEVLNDLLKAEFGVDPVIPDPGELPGAGDLDGGDGSGDGGDGGEISI